MASNEHQDTRNPSTPPQSIPLQDLARPPDSSTPGGRPRGRSLVPGSTRRSSGQPLAQRYERLKDASPDPSPTEGPYHPQPPVLPKLTTQPEHMDYGANVDSPAEFQSALGFAGLSRHDEPQATLLRSETPSRDFDGVSPYAHPSVEGTENPSSYFPSDDFDRVRLTDPAYLQPVSGHEGGSLDGRERSSFQSVRFNTPDSKIRGSRLGDNLPGLETGTEPARTNSLGASLSPDDRSRLRASSVAGGTFQKAGSIMRAMSQRVVNLSNEADLHPHPPPLRRNPSNLSIQESIRPTSPVPPPSPLREGPMSFHPDVLSPVEKAHAMNFTETPLAPHQVPNPLKGKSLGIFSADNPLRMKLCDILVHPVTEPTILILIIIQTIFLAVDASKSVFDDPRPNTWGDSRLDFAMLVLFSIYTAEILVRIIVSGFIHNAPEYSTIDRERGVRGAVVDKYKTIFAPQRQASVKKPVDPNSQNFAPSIVRTFTSNFHSDMPLTQEQTQRRQLARRAFLRHGFNRLDFVAVVAFWISFAMGVFGVEHNKHVYVFKMLSCLRILRLLAITGGTSVGATLFSYTRTTLTCSRSFCAV